MAFVSRPRYTWRLRTRSLPLGRRTVLMGILNVTPDSFSDGNQYFNPHAAVDHALRLLDEGADLLDIGGESTRPNATPVSPTEEQERILPVLRAILKLRRDAILSVDTYHASTAERAVEFGAEIINDVSGLIWDPAMAKVLARDRPGAFLMHTRGAPRGWSNLPPLGDENFTLLAHFAELHQFGLPFLIGVSRKRFLTAHLPQENELTRQEATTAANTAAILSGAHVLRVHNIPAARAAASVADSILSLAQPETEQPHPSGIRKTFSV